MNCFPRNAEIKYIPKHAESGSNRIGDCIEECALWRAEPNPNYKNQEAVVVAQKPMNNGEIVIFSPVETIKKKNLYKRWWQKKDHSKDTNLSSNNKFSKKTIVIIVGSILVVAITVSVAISVVMYFINQAN